MISYYLILEIDSEKIINDVLIFDDKSEIGHSGYPILKSGTIPFCRIKDFNKKCYILVLINQQIFNDFLNYKKKYFIGEKYINFLKKEGFDEYAI